MIDLIHTYGVYAAFDFVDKHENASQKEMLLEWVEQNAGRIALKDITYTLAFMFNCTLPDK
ncbi:MAG: hypothetical protein LBT24_06955 [Tannerella sp.]|jgi:hypothetical protein|nr:hypothetical protein [Tannerella sp.]